MTLRDLILALWPHVAAPALPARLPPVRLRGVATTYWPGDGHNNGRLGCVAAARRWLGHSHFRDGDAVIATRDAPKCGTRVYVEHARTGRGTWAVKLDTGTWSCYWPDGTRTVEGPRRCVQAGGKRGAIADLSRTVARRIGHDGRDTILLRWR